MQIQQPVIFLPGTLCDERVWMPVWQRLSIDQRGYVPLQWAEEYEQMLALTDDRIENTSQKVHLIGFSMGGYIASLAAIKHPDAIASLTLIGYHPGGLSDAEITQRQGILKSIQQRRFKGMDRARLTHFFTESEMKLPATQTVLDMESDLGSAVLAAHIRSTTPRKDLTQALSNLTVPIHFIAAEFDKIAPSSLMATASENMRQANFTQIRDTAHMMLLTQPDKCAEAIHNNLSIHSDC